MTPETIVYAALTGAAWFTMVGVFVGYRIHERDRRIRAEAADRWVDSVNAAMAPPMPACAPARTPTVWTVNERPGRPPDDMEPCELVTVRLPRADGH